MAHINYEICSSIVTVAACTVVGLGDSTLLFCLAERRVFSNELADQEPFSCYSVAVIHHFNLIYRALML